MTTPLLLAFLHPLDALVLLVYFAVMIGIGVFTARRIHKQEDYFLGGRSFGKLLQTFAAFGAGTGSSDPVNTAGTTFTSGMSGMWSVMYWLFVTPFYWITGVWYRRMRLLTLGDWFVERYQSPALGLGYALFGLTFFMVYGSMFFSAIGKVAAPLTTLEAETVVLLGAELPLTHVLVPVIGLVVLIYGIAGGLEAAYYTDLIQGLCIILLSVILVPFGLTALVEKFGDPAAESWWAGFRIMHEQLPPEHFHVIGNANTSEFPLHRIIAVVLINLVGIVVQPHFIATGGGSAKTETNARVGLVTGNFLKRFCTIGWVLTALIALALYSDSEVLAADPEKTWGVASKALLGPGLTGLMLACLLAALMSSVDAYMVVGSALVVRNIYAPYINDQGSEKEYLLVGRITGALIVVGAVVISLFMMDVFKQLQLVWVFGVLFAAPFWVGMYWRRATLAAAWTSVAFCLLVFFLIPVAAPRLAPQLRDQPALLIANPTVRTTVTRRASPSDAAAENARRRAAWELDGSPADRTPDLVRPGDPIPVVSTTGGQSVYWPDGVRPVNEAGEPMAVAMQVVEQRRVDDDTLEEVLAYPADTRLRGFGNFQLDYLLYDLLGLPLESYSNATLDTLRLPAKIVTPFLVMILVSLVTPRTNQEALDRYYAKMKTPVIPDREQDRQSVESALQHLEALEAKKLFPGTDLEFQRPTRTDIAGFVVSVLICFGVIYLAIAAASIGS